MRRPWLLFFTFILTGLAIIALYSRDPAPLSDEPERIPTRTEVVKPGYSTQEVIRTSDEARVPELMRPTPLTRLVVRDLTEISCKHGTKRCVMQAIYDFIRMNYEYKPQSPEHYWIQTPGETLLYGSGDELELGILLASLQRSAGFETEILRSTYHTFVRVKYENQTYTMDPSCQGCRFMDVRVQLRGDEDLFR